ncbi:MAG TPA: hypothetical protein VF808_12990 [Ktedonobacterales bacterium]
MRQAIRVYAVVALVVTLAFVVGLLVRPESVAGAPGWVDRTLFWALWLQIWVLPLIPLGVLAASDAARAGRRGWLALFIALIVLVPFAAWIGNLTNNIAAALTPPCINDSACLSGPVSAPEILQQVGWVVAFLPIPIAALVYSFTAARSATGPAFAEARQGEARALIVWAIAGVVIMTALGYLGTPEWSSSPLASWFGGHGAFGRTLVIFNLLGVLNTLWYALAALPVAVVSVALAHAARTGRRGWLAGWIALATLALLTADIGNPWGESAIAAVLRAHSSDQIPYFTQLTVIGIVAPAVIMLVALVYGLTVMRPPQQRQAAPALA